MKAAGAAGVAGLAGCLGEDEGDDGGGGDDDGNGEVVDDDVVQIEAWTLFGGGDGDAFDAIVEDFNDEHDGIQVESTTVPWDEYYDRLFTSMTGGQPPDFGVYHAERLATYADTLVPLDDHIEFGDYVGSIESMTTVDGTHVAAPLDSHPMAIFYNKDIYEEAGHDPEQPPENWDEFQQVNDDIVDAGYTAFDPSEGNGYRMWNAWTFSRGSEILTESDGTWEVGFNNEDGLAVTELWPEFIERGWCGQESDPSWENFVEGEHGAIWEGTWSYSRYKEGGGEEVDFDWGTYKPSVVPGKEGDYTRANSHSLGVPQNPERSDEETEAAITAVEWITKEGSISWATGAGHMPGYEEVLESDELREDPVWDKQLSMFYDMAVNDEFWRPPQTPSPGEFVEIMRNSINSVRYGELEPQEMLDDAESRLTNAMN